eukprot:1159658-Pelagomonas_calceolata.AAC.5
MGRGDKREKGIATLIRLLHRIPARKCDVGAVNAAQPEGWGYQSVRPAVSRFDWRPVASITCNMRLLLSPLCVFRRGSNPPCPLSLLAASLQGRPWCPCLQSDPGSSWLGAPRLEPPAQMRTHACKHQTSECNMTHVT